MTADDGGAELVTVLEASVCAVDDVEFAVLFGSQITGESTQASDLDLAVKFSDDLSEAERFERRCFLSGDLQRDDLPFVDVSDIESLPLAVAHDAVKGTFVCGDTDAFARFKTRIEARFGDQRDDLRRRKRAVIDRIAEDGLRG
jgi:predicted nucleotidyltransferase